MIQVDYATFFLIVFLAPFLLLVIAWGRLMWQRRQQRWNNSQPTLGRCRKCSYTYLVERGRISSTCPACHEQNRIPRRRAARRLQYIDAQPSRRD